jgi:hypothetical protein
VSERVVCFATEHGTSSGAASRAARSPPVGLSILLQRGCNPVDFIVDKGRTFSLCRNHSVDRREIGHRCFTYQFPSDACNAMPRPTSAATEVGRVRSLCFPCRRLPAIDGAIRPYPTPTRPQIRGDRCSAPRCSLSYVTEARTDSPDGPTPRTVSTCPRTERSTVPARAGMGTGGQSVLSTSQGRWLRSETAIRRSM